MEIRYNTQTTSDQPAQRGDQLLAALDFTIQRSSVRNRIDPARQAVIGHSMGGGGTLEAAKSRPSLQAAIPLTGWNTDKTWPELRTPTLVVGADGDTIASVSSHSEPFYNSLPSTLEAAKDRPSLQAAVPLTPWNLDKSWPEVRTPTLIFGADGDSIAPVSSHAEPLYSGLPSSLDRADLELTGATHFTPNSSNTTIAKYSISWLKRFIDNDTRYEQFLCPLPRPSLTIEEYRGNCPHNS